jgi:hypothetical protein
MTGQTQLEILKEAVELLGKLADGSGTRFSAVEGKDIRRSFINRHAWNVHDIARDVLVLGGHGDLRSIYLLSRPALESLFKLAAAVATPDFAAQKVVAEVQDEQEKIKRWLEARPAWQDVLKQVEVELCDYEKELRTRYGITGQKKWKPYQVANEGKMSASYVGDYFVGSQHVHAALRSLVDREDALYIPAGIYGLTMTVTHACALLNKALMDLENCIVPNIFEHVSDINERAKEAYENKPAPR